MHWFQRVNQRLQDGEGADQHRDGTRHFAAEVGLHRTGKNKQPIRKTMGRGNSQQSWNKKINKQTKNKQTKNRDGSRHFATEVGFNQPNKLTQCINWFCNNIQYQYMMNNALQL